MVWHDVARNFEASNGFTVVRFFVSVSVQAPSLPHKKIEASRLARLVC